MNSFAPTEGRWALLRPLYPTDVELLFNAEVARSNWWRLRGKTPSAGEYDAILAMNVEVQFMICARAAPHTPLGLVAAYSMDTRNGHCYLAVMRVGDEQGIPKAMVEGLGMFLDYIFLGWPVRKIFR